MRMLSYRKAAIRKHTFQMYALMAALVIAGTAHRLNGQPVQEPIKVPGGLFPSKLLKKAQPVYPAAARNAHVEGAVWLRATIGRDGTMQHLEVIEGPPMLADAALKAVRQWVFEPYPVDGQPRSVQTVLQVQFAFTGSPEPAQDPRLLEYPHVAMATRLVSMVDPTVVGTTHGKGLAQLDLLVNSAGAVEEAIPVHGPADLLEIARNAVMQWKYKPYFIRGQPATVLTRVTFDFQ